MSQNNIGIDLNMKTRMARDKTSGLSKSFVQLSKDGKSADTSMIGLTNSVSGLNKVLHTAGVYAFARALGKATQAAADIRESVHMYNVAMGDFAEVTAEAIDELSELSGMDRIKMLDSVGEFNLLARSMGLTSDNSAVLSENMNRLALDLSSLTNRDVIKVQEDFKSGLLGRSRTVYKYGIDITEAALAQEALAQGISKSVRHMSQAEKMQLRYIIMLRTTALAHGDFAETIETPANQMRIFSDRILSVTRSLGTIFIPMLTKVMPYLNAFAKVLDTVFKSLARLVGYNPKVYEGIKNTGDAFGDATGDLEDGLDDAGKSSDEATKKVNKLKKKVQQLAGFDELNILGKHETPITPKVPKKKKVDGDDMSDFNLDLTGYDSDIGKIKQKSDELYESMINWMKKVRDAAKPTTNALVRLWNEGLKDLSKFSSTALKDFYHNFLVPVGLWTLGEQGLARFINVLNDMLREIHWTKLNKHLSELFKALAPFAISIGTGLIDFFKLVYAPFVVWTFNDAVPSMLDAITKALKRIDWGNINLKLRDFFEMLGITVIEVHKPLYGFIEKVLIPIAEWTIGTGFPKLLEILTEGMGKIKWKKIHGSFDNLWDVLAPFGVRIGEGLLWLMENVLVPLAAWTISNVLPFFLDVLSTSLDTIGVVLDVVSPLFKVLWDVLIEPLAVLIGMGLEAFGGVLKFFTPVLTGFLLAWGVIKTLALIGQITSFTREISIFSEVARGLGGNLARGGSGGLAGLVNNFGATLLVAGDGARDMGAMFKGVARALFSPTGVWILLVGAGLVAIKKLSDYLKKDAVGDVKLYGEGVSSVTEEAVGNYLELHDRATFIMKEIKWTSMEITEEMSEELTGLYNRMSGSILTELEAQKKVSLEVIDGISEETLKKHGVLAEEVRDIINGSYDDRIKITEEKEERVNEILKATMENGGVMREEHRLEMAEIEEGMKNDGIEILSQSEEEQLIIMNNLKREGTKISTKAAAEIVERSHQRKKDLYQEASDEYDEQMVIAENLRKQGGKKFNDLADAIIEDAERQRTRSEEEAEGMHTDVMKEFDALDADITENIDRTTGTIIDGWGLVKKNVLEDMAKLRDDPAKYFNELVDEAARELNELLGYGPKFSGFSQGIITDSQNLNKDAGGFISTLSLNGGSYIAGLTSSGLRSFGDLEEKGNSDMSDLSKGVGSSLFNTQKYGSSNIEKLKVNANSDFKGLNKDGSKNIGELEKSTLKNFGVIKKDGSYDINRLNSNATKDFGSLSKNGTEDIGWLKTKVLKHFGVIKEDGSYDMDMLNINSNDSIRVMKQGIGSSMGETVTTVGSKFGEMLTNSDTTVGKIVSGVSAMPGKMGDAITRGAGAVSGAFKKLWEGVVKAIGIPVNKVIDGGNWILDKFGVSKKKQMSPWSYAKGTDGHPGGPAMVNDQRGSTYRELVEFPDGRQVIPKGRNVIMPRMPRGTKVLPADMTKNLQMYAGGIGNWAKDILSGGKNMVKTGWANLKGFGKKFWEYATKPGELTKGIIDKLVSYDGINGVTKDMASGLVNNKAIPAMTEWATNKFAENEGSNPANAISDEFGGIGFPSPPYRKTSGYGRRVHPIFGMGKMHHGIDLAAPFGTPVNAQRAGKVNHAKYTGGYGNMVRIAQGRTSQIYAHLSKILTKAGANVRAGQRIGNVGSTGDSTGNHLHYEMRKDGSSVNPGNPLYDATKRRNSTHAPNIERWRGTVTQALRMNHLPTSPAYVEAWLRQIKTESNGNERNIQSVVDINSRRGQHARGLVQVIPPTFQRYKHRGYENQMVGLHSLLAGMNYAKSRYGTKDMLRAIGQGRGYAKGGFITGMTSFNVAGESGNEGIVPLEGKHMIPFADAVADRLSEHTQNAIDNSGMNKSSQGDIIIKIGERTIVDVLGSEINRKSKINGKTLIKI